MMGVKPTITTTWNLLNRGITDNQFYVSCFEKMHLRYARFTQIFPAGIWYLHLYFFFVYRSHFQSLNILDSDLIVNSAVFSIIYVLIGNQFSF